ncbi:MAG: hypothetical protein NUW01_04680 [Gemmatimonadaceae bacterium]|nr:hypothetical protein [Gemmatimonadaceae bacterium]
MTIDIIADGLAYERGRVLDDIAQLHIVRPALSKLRKADESLSAHVKQYLGLNNLEELTDYEIVEAEAQCPVCLGEPVTLHGPYGARVSKVGGTRWVDTSQLDAETRLWAVDHGLLKLDSAAFDGLKHMTDPSYVRFAMAVKQGTTERLTLITPEAS